MKPERLAYRVKEVAECLGVSTRTVYTLITAGKLRTTKFGGCTLIPADDLRAIMEPKSEP